MKKIIFYLHDFSLGGTEKALLSMFKCADFTDYDITIGVVNTRGPLRKEFEQFAHIVKIPMSDIQRDEISNITIKDRILMDIKRFHVFHALKVFDKRIHGDFFSHFSFNINDIPASNDAYDIAVCYQMHNPFLVKYVADKVTADRKLIWIHNDFSTSNYKVEFLKNELLNYTNIFAVSRVLQDEFISRIPELKERTTIMYNYFDKDGIIEKSKVTISYKKNKTTILSVGRLNSQKGFDLAIKVANILKNKGYDFEWLIIGEGGERTKLEKLITKFNVSDCVKLIGSVDNPYPYFRMCDIYCQPSRDEGYCTTTNEAKILKKPVITTRVAGSDEQFINKVNGLIVDIDVDSIVQGLEKMMDKEYRNSLSEKL